MTLLHFMTNRLNCFIVKRIEKGGIGMAYQIDFKDQVAIFTIDRPERKNAISTEVADGLEAFLDQLEGRLDLSFAVVTGADRVFCSGGDVAEYQSLITAEDARPMLHRMARLLYRLTSLPMPVIALIDGVAVGGGCEIATACDYRLMTRGAKAGFIQGTIALTTGWGGATLLFEKLQKQDDVLRLLSEAKVHTAEELHRLGWVTDLYEGDKFAALQQFLKTQNQINRNVHQTYKKIWKSKLEVADVEVRMLEEAENCAVLWESEAHHEAVQRFLTKSSKVQK